MCHLRAAACVCCGGGGGVLSGLQLVMHSGALCRAVTPTSKSYVGIAGSAVGLKKWQSGLGLETLSGGCFILVIMCLWVGLSCTPVGHWKIASRHCRILRHSIVTYTILL